MARWKRHQDLEQTEGPCDQAHSAGAHPGLMQTVGHRDGKGIHGQPDTEQDTVQEKQQVPFHVSGPPLSKLRLNHNTVPWCCQDGISELCAGFSGSGVEFMPLIWYNYLFI